VADCAHILTNFVHALRAGKNKHHAIVESLRLNLQPVFLTSLTTAIGFLSMNFSDTPPFRDLGNIVAMGVMVAFVLAVTLLPAMLAILPARIQPSAALTVNSMSHIADFVIRRRRFLFRFLGPLFVLIIAFIPRNELNDQFVEYFDETIEFRRATDFSIQNLTGIDNIQYSLRADETGGVSNPEFLENVEAFANWYRLQPGAIHINTITDTFKRLNKNLHNDDDSHYRIPTRRNLAAQYLLLYEMSLPYGLDLNDQINVDRSATRLVATLQKLTSAEIIELENRAQRWMQDHAPAMQTDGSSPSIMFSHIGARNIRSMLIGTSVALVLISMVLVVAFRSIKIGIVSLAPNLMPAALAFGIWGLLVGQVGLALSVVAAMTIGIVVDDTVHFLSKYLRARREEQLSTEDAVRYAFFTVGTALWVTSLVLTAGFLGLSRSAFEVNSGMGLLTAITIVIALIADFLFLPPLLMAVDRDSNALADTSASAHAT